MTNSRHTKPHHINSQAIPIQTLNTNFNWLYTLVWSLMPLKILIARFCLLTGSSCRKFFLAFKVYVSCEPESNSTSGVFRFFSVFKFLIKNIWVFVHNFKGQSKWMNTCLRNWGAVIVTQIWMVNFLIYNKIDNKRNMFLLK